MQLNPSEISDLIKSRIQNLQLAASSRNEGTVVSVTDGITRIHGLTGVMQGEMLEFPGNTFGLALNLERDSVGAVVLGDYENLREGDTAKTTGQILSVPIGPEMLGRVVNALGEAIDGKGPIEAKLKAPVETIAAVERAVKRLAGARSLGGRMAFSIVPRGAPTKGAALTLAAARLRCDAAVYVGDDQTDEEAFGVWGTDRLLAIRVGMARRSHARFGLKNQAEIDDLLRVLAAMRSSSA